MEAKLLTARRFVDMETGCSYRYILSDTEYFRPHYHDYYEIFILLDGAAKHLVNGTVIPLKKNDMVFIRPSDTHDYASYDGKTFSMLNITFTTETAEQIFDYLGEGFPSKTLTDALLPPFVHLNAGELAVFNARMAAVRAISSDDASLRKTVLRTLIFDIFTKYYSDFSSNSHTVPLWLEELCSEIRKSGSFTDGSKKLFSLTDKSREHVCRSMKKYMGVTVTEFINDLRLTYICNMLLNSNHSITEIIYESGFNNISWASELFKAKFCITMCEYRRTMKQ